MLLGSVVLLLFLRLYMACRRQSYEQYLLLPHASKGERHVSQSLSPGCNCTLLAGFLPNRQEGAVQSEHGYDL